MDKREKEYQEYLSLRLHEQEEEVKEGYDEKYGQFFPEHKEHTRRISVTETPYGVSELRKAQKEKERRDREMKEYLAAREADRNERGVRSGIVHTDYDEYGNHRYRHRKKNKKNTYKQLKKEARQLGKTVRRGRRTPLMVLLIVLALFVVLAVGGTAMALSTLASAQNIPIDENNIGIDAGASASLDGYRNILVLGTDARKGEDSMARSDAIIVASINEDTDEVKLFSVFRDTLLDIGDGSLDKITHAYFYGGAQQSLKAINMNLDLNIDEVVVINWKTVADTIDAVGGIEIDVQESELEELNKYIPNTAKNVDGPSDKVESAGKQTLNGVQAVTYARIRKDAATGDYRRNERMKIVFSETFKKIKESGPIRMLSVAKHAVPEVQTNLGTFDMFKLMLKAKSFDMTDSTTGFPYDVEGWTGTAWYGVPVNLSNNVSKLHAQFFNQEGYSPSSKVQEISNSIANRTGIY